MERDERGSGSERRGKARRGSRISAGGRGDPLEGGKGQAKRVPAEGAGGSASGDEPIGGEYVPSSEKLPMLREVPLPLPDDGASISEYKGISLKNIGRDARGRVIPHKFSSKIAKQIAVWISGGYNVNDICIRLNIRPGLLKELYGKEIATGLEQVGMEMTEHIVKRAKKSDTMAKFFAKARMGWRDGDGKPTDTGILNIHIHA